MSTKHIVQNGDDCVQKTCLLYSQARGSKLAIRAAALQLGIHRRLKNASHVGKIVAVRERFEVAHLTKDRVLDFGLGRGRCPMSN